MLGISERSGKPKGNPLFFLALRPEMLHITVQGRIGE